MLIPVILSGGSGTRLWPLSNQDTPKQFLNLISDRSLLQETLLRVAERAGIAEPMIIGSVKHRELLQSQTNAINIPISQFVYEPVGRNTAPALAVAALSVLSQNQDPVLLVLASDHIIRDTEAFYQAILRAKALAEAGKMVTFGIVPTMPSTGFGYIKRGAAISESEVFEVEQFVEKPNAETAVQYLASGNYDWNSGMFAFKASKLIEEMEQHCPDLLAACRKTVDSARVENNECYLNEDDFTMCEKISIDYAVMEKTQNGAVVPISVGWSDVGSWDSLLENSPKNAQGNVVIGDVKAKDVTNSYLHSETKPIVVLGVDDVVVVETEDAVLVAAHKSAQDIKSLVE